MFLLVILIQEEIDLWSAIGFSSMYIVYVIAQGCKCFLVLEDQRAQGFLFYNYFLYWVFFSFKDFSILLIQVLDWL